MIYKKCPFCGNDDDNQKISLLTHFGKVILCKICGAQGPIAMEVNPVNLWNTRNSRWNSPQKLQPESAFGKPRGKE